MKYTFIGVVIALLAVVACGQSRTNRLYRPCPGVGQQARVEINRSGDVDLVPCSGRSLLLNGVPFSNGFTVSGASRTNYIPYFSSETNLAKSPFSWDGSVYTFNNPTGDSLYTMQFMPSPTGYFRLGTNDDFQRLNWSFQFAQVNWTLGFQPYTQLFMRPTDFSVISRRVLLGDVYSDGNNTSLQIDDNLKKISLLGDGSVTTDLSGIGNYNFNRTLTTTGCGGVTINKPVGSVTMCAGSTSLQVNNTIVNPDSIIIPVARTYDATCTVRAVVPDAGNFVIFMTAACSGNTSIGWIVLN